jgi:hypothetical protein
MRSADELQTAFLWWTTRWVLIPGAIVILFVVLIMSRIETRECMKSCTAAGFGGYIYSVHRGRSATCECAKPRPKGADQ